MPRPSVSTTKKVFGSRRDGSIAHAYTLTNTHGLRVSVSDYGATLLSFCCPDKHNQFADIVLGHDTLQAYLDADSYMGATVGRFANRIAEGRFVLDGQVYSLEKNNGNNHLHGGTNAFDKRIWQAHYQEDEASVRFNLHSPDGDEGYPGAVDIECHYCLDDDNVLSIVCEATSTKATPISLTHHSYFNLLGSGSVADHFLQIEADDYTPLNENQIPTGDITPVEGSPFDFRKGKRVGDDINSDHQQLAIAGGFDHNFVLSREQRDKPILAARIGEATSGRQLSVYTNAPGLQLYTANFLDGSTKGKGVSHEKRSALCLEPQHFPDAPNKNTFPTCILTPDETYRQVIQFKVANTYS